MTAEQGETYSAPDNGVLSTRQFDFAEWRLIKHGDPKPMQKLYERSREHVAVRRHFAIVDALDNYESKRMGAEA